MNNLYLKIKSRIINITILNILIYYILYFSNKTILTNVIYDQKLLGIYNITNMLFIILLILLICYFINKD